MYRRRNSRWYSQYGRGESYGETGGRGGDYNPLGYGESYWSDLPRYVKSLLGSEDEWDKLDEAGLIYYCDDEDLEDAYEDGSIDENFYEAFRTIINEWYHRISAFGTKDPSIGFNYVPRDPKYVDFVKNTFNAIVTEYNHYSEHGTFTNKLRLDPLTLNGIVNFWFAIHLTSELGDESPLIHPTLARMKWPMSTGYTSLINIQVLAKAVREFRRANEQWWNQWLGPDQQRQKSAYYDDDDYYDDE